MKREGILVIHKEQNMTSHDVVAAVRRGLGIRKVGHTGTLDPMAEGVLPVCLGQAARIMEYLEPEWKTYVCEMKFGQAYDTLDVWGRPEGPAEPDAVAAVTEQSVREALAALQGRVRQKVPVYSAVHVNGKRLYEYAREGRSVDVPEREVFIRAIEPVSFDLGRGTDSTAEFRVTCTRGTYIRSLCEAVGRTIGVPAAMSALTRTASGAFRLSDAVRLDSFLAMEDAEKDRWILPVDRALPEYGEAELREEDAVRFQNGLAVWAERAVVKAEPYFADHPFPIPAPEKLRRIYRMYCGGAFVGMGRAEMEEGRDVFRPEKVFLQKESE